MVRQVSFLKHPTFFKTTAPTWSGALAEAVKQCPADSVAVGIILPKTARLWGYVKPEQLLTMLEKNNGVYEIAFKYPQRVYFDIDKKASAEEAETRTGGPNDWGLPFLATVKEILSEYFPDAEYAVSGSVTEEKTSFHLTLNNYTIHNDEERHQLKMITKYLKENVDSCFDSSVYSSNHLMKCFNQGKTDGRIQKILENDDPKKHMITCFINDTCLPFPTLATLPEAVKELVFIEKSKAAFDLAMLPKLNLPCPKNINIDTITAQQVLELLPNDGSMNFTYRHRVCRFCHTNGVEFNVLLAWICQRFGDTLTPALQKDKQKQWSSHWGNITKYPPCYIDGMKPILKQFYPNICKDMHFRRFFETFNMKNESIEKIATIAPEFFNQDEKCCIFNVGMGGGKTEQTISYLQDKDSYCWIAPNKALASNTHRRFEQKDIDVCHYEAFKMSEKEDGILKKQDKLIIVLNSLNYITDKEYDVLVIDEIETLFDKFLGYFLERENLQLKGQIWKNFIHLFKSAKKIILMDAFITSKTLNFLKSLEIEDANVLDNKYLYHYLTYTNFSNMGAGIIGNGSLNKTSLNELKIPIPSLEKQKEIIECLDFVENTNQTSKTKIAELKKLNELCFTHQKQFGDNTFKTLGEVCNFKNGKGIKKDMLVDGEYPVIGGGQTPMGYHEQFNTNEHVILCSSSGAYAGFISKYATKCWASDCFSIIPINDMVTNDYLYYWLKSIQSQIYKSQTGAAQPHVYSKDFQNIKMVIPSLEKQQEIVEFCEANNTIIKQLEQRMIRNKSQFSPFNNNLALDSAKRPFNINRPEMIMSSWVQQLNCDIRNNLLSPVTTIEGYVFGDTEENGARFVETKNIEGKTCKLVSFEIGDDSSERIQQIITLTKKEIDEHFKEETTTSYPICTDFKMKNMCHVVLVYSGGVKIK